MIDRHSLLSDLQSLLQRLEADLLQRSESVEVPEVGRRLREEYERAKKAQRTAQNYEDWRSDAITQAAAAWVLSCVFVRFLEDNRLIDPPKIAGPGKRLQQARDEWEMYLGKAKQPNERDYLLSVFDELARLPGIKEVFGEHNPIRELPNWLSGDGARELLAFFQKIDANSAESNKLIHDFTDPGWETRFLGDLYQELSEAARKKYALLQTPEFVEEFILDRTLEPALNEFGLDGSGQQSAVSGQQGKEADSCSLKADGFRMIDPACGSGHFLLGSFRRILERWQRNEPGANIRDLVQRTLDSIHGVDINPYAVAIARFRLLLVAMKACGATRLADAPAFHFNLVCGDSLLHGTGAQGSFGWHDLDHAYQAEDHAELVRILKPGHYHAVVANPPYITPKDKALNDAYRERYSTCYRQYSLAVPFMQRLFQLAVSGYGGAQQGGFVGQITSNSFMKREFGKKLIEEYFAGHDGTPGVDLTHVIDTSGAYIPGHGTPTVILFGRNRAPVAKTIRAVMGIRGEPSTPEDPSHGFVWSAIVAQIDNPGSNSEFVSVGDSPRQLFHTHPWSLGGGGAAELKEQLDQSRKPLSEKVELPIGRAVRISEESAFTFGISEWSRRGLPKSLYRRFAKGEDVRDWEFVPVAGVFYPYAMGMEGELGRVLVVLWQNRTVLRQRSTFQGTFETSGLDWFEFQQHTASAYQTPLSILFANIATHNHFVLDRGGAIFDCTAPVIKLHALSTEDAHLSLIGCLNSSTACFWLKQVCQTKGSSGIGRGVYDEAWEKHFAFSGTNIGEFPVPEEGELRFGRDLDSLAMQLADSTAISVLGTQQGADAEASRSLRKSLALAEERWREVRSRMIALQEELDWACYRRYGLLNEHLTCSAVPPCLRLGQRAFEIVLARKMATGELQTTWFERHGSTPTTELPAGWPEDYKRLVERRIELIETDRNIALIEQPEYKRRWNTEPWESQLERALRNWLLDRLESYFDFDGRMSESGQQSAVSGQQDKRAESRSLIAESSMTSVARLADVVRQDPDFMQVGELYRNDPAFDVERLVAELVEAESVPLLPVLRYKATGLRKRAEWEQTWELQREEDRTGQRLDVPVPPKYTSADFLKSDYWRLRGKLDVPKERWVSFPHCEGPDGTPVIAWAGYDHLQLARAASAYYVDIQERLGGRDDPRLVPLLAGLLELLPWLKQWHNEPDAAFDGMRMGDYFEGFVNEEARQLGKTVPEIKAWQPPQRGGAKGGGRGKKK